MQEIKRDKKRFKRFKQYLEKFSKENFTGYIKIDLIQGDIGKIERFEEILKK